jgi:hypothetical protein
MPDYIRVYTRQEKNTYLPGDINPADFDFNLILTREQKLVLYKRNEIMQLMCEWPVIEALRQRVTFEEDQDVEYMKFGKVPFTFTATPETFDEITGEIKQEQQAYSKYLEWTGFWLKMREGMSWSQLFGISAAFLWDENKGVADHVWERSDKTLEQEPIILDGGLYYGPNEDGIYSDFDFYYPATAGNGFIVKDVDEKGNATLYEVTLMTEGMKRQKKFYMSAERVVEFPAPRREITYGGNSMTIGLELYALAGEHMTQDLTRRSALLAGGIATFSGIDSNEEAVATDNALGDDITSLDRLFLQTGVGFDYIAPDLKISGEFYSLFDILTRVEARFLRFSQKLMDGESQGVQGSAKFDLLSSYTRIYGIQQHYNRPIEEMFYRLGKTNTAFTWNPIIPEMLDDSAFATTGDETFFSLRGDSKEQDTKESEKE